MASDNDRDIQDIGRAINMIMTGMRKRPLSDPVETVKRYVSDDLLHFRKENVDIFDGMVREEGIPPFRLLPGGFIKPGGTGVVFQVANADAPVHYALKFARPSLYNPEDRDQTFTAVQTEFLRHAPLSHNNVAR